MKTDLTQNKSLPKCPTCGVELFSWKSKTCVKHRDMKTACKKMVEARRKKGNYVPWNKGLRGYKAGKEHYNWKGGVTPERNKIRNTFEYRQWQNKVFEHDDNTCQKCGEIDQTKLSAHHILGFNEFPKLRLDIVNGITFCKKCHKNFHDQFGKGGNTRDQLNEFLKA